MGEEPVVPDEIPVYGDSSVTVEIGSLSVYTHHGVSEAERELGQRLLFDVTFDLEHCDAVLTDRVEDTVDYAQVCDLIDMAATDRSYRTLERLCEAVAGALLDRFSAATSVTVRATKPEPPIPLPVGEVSVEVLKERPQEEDEEGE